MTCESVTVTCRDRLARQLTRCAGTALAAVLVWSTASRLAQQRAQPNVRFKEKKKREVQREGKGGLAGLDEMLIRNRDDGLS